MKINLPRQTKLNQEQREAVGLLSIGTFLEYFDLMLYVHMAVLLNDLFFPKTDPYIKSIITASAFCSTYIMRPFGALIFGWIGDNYGRRVTLIITILLMSSCCIIMSILPTYAQVGITASVLVTCCRIVQGMSSMGEIIGAQIYITELIKIPKRYPAVACIALSASVGSFGALGIASLVFLNPNLSWRIAFLIGAFIATIGWFARSSLRETPEFVDAKKRYKNILNKAGFESKITLDNELKTMRIGYKTPLSLFALDCMWPVCFYFTYIYCGSLLQDSFGYSASEVIQNNLVVSIFQIGMDLTFLALCSKIHPLKILQIKAWVIIILFLIFPMWINSASSGFHIMIFQCLVVFFGPDAHNAASCLYSHFHTLKRFTYSSFLYALSRAFVYILTAYGFLIICKYYGNIGISVFVLSMAIAYLFGRNHFVTLEKNAGHSYPFVNS